VLSLGVSWGEWCHVSLIALVENGDVSRESMTQQCFTYVLDVSKSGNQKDLYPSHVRSRVCDNSARHLLIYYNYVKQIF
jgi:hypothetical protein